MNKISTELAATAPALVAALIDASLYYEDGGWMVDAIETAETFADYEAASRLWTEGKKMTSGIFGGLPYIQWTDVQIYRGQPRRTVAVIDCGPLRISIDADLS